MSDHVPKVGAFSFLYCGNYLKPLVCQFYYLFICFPTPPGYFHHLPICPHFKRLQFFHISGGYCPRFTSDFECLSNVKGLKAISSTFVTSCDRQIIHQKVGHKMPEIRNSERVALLCSSCVPRSRMDVSSFRRRSAT